VTLNVPMAVVTRYFTQKGKTAHSQRRKCNQRNLVLPIWYADDARYLCGSWEFCYCIVLYSLA